MSLPRLLITGSSGLLGHELCAHFSGRYQLIRHAFAHGHADSVACDLREPREVRALVQDATPDVVIHTAAYRDPDYCEEHQQDAHALNVGAVESLTHALPDGTRFVFISSDYVFNGAQPPYTENSPVSPLSEYGRTKAQAEQIACRRPGSLVLRIPVLIGHDPRPGKPGFLQQMASQLRSGHAAQVDDVLVRRPAWTRDVAHALDFLLHHDASGIHHVGPDEGGTRYELTCRLAGLLGLSHAHLSPSKTVIHRLAARPRDSRLSSARLLRDGFQGFTPFAEVVRVVLGAPA